MALGDQMNVVNVDAIRELTNLCSGFTNWHQRTFSRPVPSGSQDGEDAIIAELLGVRTGTYVDIGAGEAVSCSNTWVLYQRGMRGLLVEPRKSAVYELCSLRPGDFVYPACASNVTGWDQLRLHGSVSSLEADWSIEEQAKTFCRVETTREILARFPEIRDNCVLFSLDVEGHERQVLDGIDWTLFQPYIIVVEFLVYGTPIIDDGWESLLLQQGYERKASTALNHIYAKVA